MTAPALAGDFPSPRATLADVVRFLDAIPSESWRERPYTPENRVRRHEIQVLRFDVLPWEEIDPAAVLSQEYAAVAEARYGVRVGVSCWWEDEGGARESESRVLWYVVAGGRLRSYDHFAFDPERGCAPGLAFRRGSEADLDFVIALRGGDACCVSYGRTCPSVEAHERGLAYVAAGRLEEAAALLAFGDAFLGLDAKGEVVSAATERRCLQAARKSRRALHERVAVGGEDLLLTPAASP